MRRASWEPGWHADDQWIAVRLTDEFIFHAPGDPERLVFYNGVLRSGGAVVSNGTISRIWHPQLGEIREIDTSGSNYRVYLANGTVFDVDQEENPGHVVDGWAFDAEGKAEPRPRPACRSGISMSSSSRSQTCIRSTGDRRMTLDELSQRHGVAIATLVDASLALGLTNKTNEPLAAADVYVVEAQLGVDRP